MTLRATRLSAIGRSASLAAGVIELVNADTGLNLLSYTRTGEYLLPQQDGTLAAVPTNTIGRYWTGARYLYRVDAGSYFQSLFSADNMASDIYWQKTGLVTYPTDQTPFGEASIALLPASGIISQAITKTGTVQTWTGIYVVGGESTSLDLTIDDNALSNRARVTINCATGQVTSAAATGTFTSMVYSIRALSNGYCMVVITANSNTATVIRARLTNTSQKTAKVALVNLIQANGFVPPIRSSSYRYGNFQSVWHSPSLSAIGAKLGAEYTIGVEYEAEGQLANAFVLRLDSASQAGDYLYLDSRGSFAPYNGQAVVVDNGLTQVSLSTQTVLAGALQRCAMRVAANSFGIAINGAAPLTDTTCSVPTVDRLFVGSAYGMNFMRGGIRRAWVAPYAMSNAELMAATA